MGTMYKLKDMLCRELDEIAGKGELSAGDLNSVHMLTDTIKNIDKIEMLDEGGGYSSAVDADMRMRDPNYSRDSYGHDRDSYGMHYVRGHYSRNGYSGADSGKAYIAEQIDNMLHGEIPQHERSALERALKILRDA